MNGLSEQAMDALEQRIPDLASGAFKQAYVRAMAHGSNVLEVLDGRLVESHPDGTHRVLKALPEPITVPAGSKRRISN